MPRKASKKGVDRSNIALYGYSYEEDGTNYTVDTESWSGSVPQKDKRIMSSLETAPGKGLLWTNKSLKEDDA